MGDGKEIGVNQMREIKFRGKVSDNNQWIHGYYIKHETRQCCAIGDDKLSEDEILHFIVLDSFADWNMPKKLNFFSVMPNTIGQYTGIDDIYEGDIAKSVDSNWGYGGEYDKTHDGYIYEVIKYKDGAFWIGEELLGDCRSFKIVGNIYDNPEIEVRL